MASILLVMLRISLPISNIELKRSETPIIINPGISLPISNIELKLVLAS